MINLNETVVLIVTITLTLIAAVFNVTSCVTKKNKNVFRMISKVLAILALCTLVTFWVLINLN